MDFKIAALTVIYNKKCKDSLTCQTLVSVKDPNIMVVIYDNSTSDYGNKEYCRANGWAYLGGTGNIGLSKAYNKCIEFLKTSVDYLCLFDDDTEFSEQYFSSLREAIPFGGDIFLPLVYSHKSLISPSKLTANYRTIFFPSEKAVFSYRGKEMTAINSGMAISFKLLHNYRYDENIFMDGVDHVFIREMKNRGYKIRPFNYRCEQHFSGNETPQMDVAERRFRILAKDYAYILKEKKHAYMLTVGKRAVHLSLEYKNPIFLCIYSKAKHKEK